MALSCVRTKAEDRNRPEYGNVATLEAAKQAFRAAWDSRPGASGSMADH